MELPAEHSVTDVTQQVTSNLNSQRSPLVWRVIDVIVGGLFIYAGVIKAMDPIGFGIDIDNYKILPWSIAARLAFYLPWLEILCGLAVVTRKYYLGALSLLVGLMTVFIAAGLIAKARGLDISCGCFGHASKNLSFVGHFFLDLAIVAALLVLWIRAPSEAESKVSP